MRPFHALCALLVMAFACGCDSSADSMPVTPTIGTIATVQGTVIAVATYTALPGVTVSIGGVTTTTRSDGTFAISGLRPGDALLTAERDGYRRFSERVVLEGARTFNIFLSRF